MSEQGEESVLISEEDEGEKECRICGGTDDELIQVCRCTSFVHLSCQARWCNERAKGDIQERLDTISNCEVCNTPLRVTPNVCAALASLECCIALLLVALAVGSHVLYMLALSRQGNNSMRTILVACNIAAISALLSACGTYAYRALRESRSRRSQVVLVFGGVASFGAAVLVFLLSNNANPV